MKKGFDDSDFINGNEYYHVTKNGEVLRGAITRDRGENYISTEHTCPCGKDTYDSYENAKRALKLRSNQRKEIYKCSICGYWHFTSKDGNRRKNKKYDKRTRNKPIVVIERDIKEEQNFKKMMKNRPSYYRIIQNEKKESKTTKKITIGDICDFNIDSLKDESMVF